MRAVRLTAVAVGHLLLWCCLVSAQEGKAPGQPEGSDEGPSQPPAAGVSRVTESQPRLYYLKDEDGNLVAVPGFTFEEFEELYQLREQLAQPDQRPRFVLQSMSATGTAAVGHADLAVQVKALVREEGWVRVPLGFDRAFLREPAEYKGPGEGFVHFEEGGQGHVAWIRGPADEQHELRLNLSVPLAGVGDETRLKLLAPRATVSKLNLKVPVPKAVGRASEGTELSVSSGGNNTTTEFTVLGLGGDFELAWRRPGRQPAQQPTVLEAEGTVLARIDARGVDAEATLKVHGSGAPFDRIRVRLPPGASLIPGVAVDPNGYSVAPVESDDASASEQGLVEVRFAEKRSGQVEVRLATRRPHDLNGPDEWFELAGFDVVGAARQWGHIDVSADNDWQVLWGERRGMRQVEPLATEDVVAGFDYHAQPYSLTARPVPKKTRISVEPEYRLLVEAGRAQLQATLQYTVRGAKAFKLDVTLPAGWESVEVEPETLVAVDGIAVTQGNLLSIPLLQPSTGKMELRISAQWPIAEGSNSLVLPLPQPQADWPGPAAVVVVPADNVELTPNHELMTGLVRQPVGPPMALPASQQPPLFYRGEAAEPVFAADFRVHARKMAVDMTSRVSLDEQAGQVQQKLLYTIDYEPANNLIVRVPRSLAESNQLGFQYAGQPLTPVTAPGGGNQPDASGEVRMQIDLPRACIGTCELDVRYPLRIGEISPGVTQLVQHEPVELSIPLVMPENATLSSSKLHVTAPPEIKLGLSDKAGAVWKAEAQRSASSIGLQLSADEPAAYVELEVELDRQEGTTVVQRAWVQTWLTHPARRDRAVFAFTSSRKELTLVVPAGAVLDDVQVLLDGTQTAARPDDQGHLIVPLTADKNRGRHLLELRFDFPRGDQPPGRLSIELPRLGGDVRVDRLYWQLVVPWNEHVIATPEELTSESTWQRNGYVWGRKPLLDPSELATWVGLEAPADGRQETLGTRGVNCYLFSSMGEVRQCELRTAERSWILLSASGVALVAGLLLIYVPLTRHPATLFAAAVVLLCVGMLYPEPALLLAQAASLGLALALLAGLLERSVARRRRATLLLETPSAILEKVSTQTHYPLPGAGTQSSTETAPAIVSPSTTDSNE